MIPAFESARPVAYLHDPKARGGITTVRLDPAYSSASAAVAAQKDAPPTPQIQQPLCPQEIGRRLEARTFCPLPWYLPKDIVLAAKASSLVIAYAFDRFTLRLSGAINATANHRIGVAVMIDQDGLLTAAANSDAYAPKDNIPGATSMQQAHPLKTIEVQQPTAQLVIETSLPHTAFALECLGSLSARGIIFSLNDLRHA